MNQDLNSTKSVDAESSFNDREVSKKVNTYSSWLLSNPPSQRCKPTLHKLHKTEGGLLYILKSNRQLDL